MKWFELLQLFVDRELLRRDIRRVLLYGPPGTGKSYWAIAQYGANDVERITLNSETPADRVEGYDRLIADGHGGTSSEFAPGVAIRAMETGKVLILDEIDKCNRELESLLYAVLDDADSARISLPGDRVVTPKDGFTVVATTNADPQCLPEALRDRFDIVLHCPQPHPDAMLDLRDDTRRLCENFYCRAEHAQGWSAEHLTFRRVRALDRLLRVDIDLQVAILATMGADNIDPVREALLVSRT